jgi:GT2 family glycosyltransferase
MRRQTHRDFTVIVVDDGSTDGTASMLIEMFGEVRVLMGDGSLWWTGATNRGIRHALNEAGEGDALLMINDDVEVDSQYMGSLFHVWQSKPDALIGSVVVGIERPHSIADGGRLLNWWTAKQRDLNHGEDLRKFGKDYHVDVSLLTGWGTLIPVRVLRNVGLYDDRHFQQCGDTELPVRAKNRGYRLIVSYDVVVKVHLDQTAGINTRSYYRLRDLRRYFFDVKSNFRLRYRFFFGYNTATSLAQFISFLICDLARISAHFLLRVRLGRQK